jgi:hypothetical protein
VVDRVQTFDGTGDTGDTGTRGRTPPPRGLTVAAGVPAPATGWAFPIGAADPGTDERLAISNPSARDAAVEVAVALDDPRRNGRPDPLSVSVPAGGVTDVDLSTGDPVPPRVGHSVVVRSAHGVGVVAELVLARNAPGRRGVASVFGSTIEARSWVLATGAPPATAVDQLVLQNLGSRSVPADIEVLAGSRLAPLRNGSPVVVPAGGRVTVALADLAGTDQAVRVRSPEPLVAERAVYRRGRPGIAFALGVAAPEGARPLPGS